MISLFFILDGILAVTIIAILVVVSCVIAGLVITIIYVYRKHRRGKLIYYT